MQSLHLKGQLESPSVLGCKGRPWIFLPKQKLQQALRSRSKFSLDDISRTTLLNPCNNLEKYMYQFRQIKSEKLNEALEPKVKHKWERIKEAELVVCTLWTCFCKSFFWGILWWTINARKPDSSFCVFFVVCLIVSLSNICFCVPSKGQSYSSRAVFPRIKWAFVRNKGCWAVLVSPHLTFQSAWAVSFVIIPIQSP